MSDELPDDLVPAREAARLVLSSRPGRGTHLSTLYRWAAAGRITAYRRGKYLFFSRGELLGLMRRQGPAPPSPAPNRKERERAQAWAQQVLDEFGI